MSDRMRGRLLVGAQFLLIALIAFGPGTRLWTSSPWLTILSVGLVVSGISVLVPAFAQLGSALTANPVPKADAHLRTSGIYARVRHPIYTGLLLSGLGVAIWRASTVSIFAFFALFVLLNFKARWEEGLLRAKYEGYLSYMRQVPRFLPRKPRGNRGV